MPGGKVFVINHLENFERRLILTVAGIPRTGIIRLGLWLERRIGSLLFAGGFQCVIFSLSQFLSL
jgi:hypothetical protein